MNQVYILLATYNGDKYLKEQLDSLLSQTYQNWILWIHDDNSTDDTVKIIREYQVEFPDKIKFLEDDISARGAKENFIYLLNKIDDNYDYLMFCDQDDIWLKDKIEITLNEMLKVEEINSSIPILIHTDLYLFENIKKNKHETFMLQQNLNSDFNTLNRLFMQNIVTGCTMMVNKNCLSRLGKIPEEAIMHDWWIALFVSAFGTIKFLNKATILYRQHDTNTVGAKQRDIKFFVDKMLHPSSLNKNFLQIKKFNEIFNHLVDSNTKKIIEIFLTLEHCGFLKSRYFMYRYNIYKHGLVRNIALFFGIIKFK